MAASAMVARLLLALLALAVLGSCSGQAYAARLGTRVAFTPSSQERQEPAKLLDTRDHLRREELLSAKRRAAVVKPEQDILPPLATIATQLSLSGDPASAYTPATTHVPLDHPAHHLRRQESIERPASTTELPASATLISSQPSATTSAMSHQNLLAIMPAFAFSMPAQIVASGINIALVSVLAVHILFTVQYHLPLSRANWILQICSTGILLVSLSVHLNAVLTSLEKESHQWPFMFPYLAEGLPPGDGSWSKVAEAFFLLMRAVTTVFIHLTHIQFLTLLFPSALEARLILWMLGPLALAAAGMEFTWLSPADDVKTSDLGDAIRNICNSTLTLLYTCALMIWGGFVNRRRAWRGDGGTAAFGAGSMGLAVINTAMSFVQIRYDRLWWLPDICWTLTIWQSWLGFWWWVGAGMGIGEVEDRAEREARRRKRRARIRRKLEKEERQRKKAELAAAAGEEGSDVLQGIRKIRDKITGDGVPASSTLSRRVRASAAGPSHPNLPDNIELRVITTHNPDTDALTPHGNLASEAIAENQTAENAADDHPAAADDARTTAGSGSSDTNPTTSAQTGTSGWMGRVGEFVDAHQPSFIRRRMRRLRLAHAAAARRAATEQTIVRNQVLNANRTAGLRAMMFDRDDGTPTVDPSARGSMAPRAGRGSNAPDDRLPSSSRRSSQRPADAVSPNAMGPAVGASPSLRNSSSVLPASLSLPVDSQHATTPSTRFSDPFASGAGTAGDGDGDATDGLSLMARGSRDGNHDDSEDDWEEDVGAEVDGTAPNGVAAPVDSPADQSLTEPEERRRGWLWRDGLDRVRLRDRQRYD
ncbi:unnamed protein product [Parajaminaea phylloscopi]